MNMTVATRVSDNSTKYIPYFKQKSIDIGIKRNSIRNLSID